MLRVTTLHAASAAATAASYAQYLAAAPGEVPGVWSGQQAAGLGLSGEVTAEALELLLSGRDPVTGGTLGRELLDRFTAGGRQIKAVSGFDATFSAPKSLSVWWALTGDDRLLDAHDAAVAVTLGHLERFGSTTRIRRDGGRLHPETGGLTIASFRQTTSRADDLQIHTHAVVSAKVQTVDGGWMALDARFLKRQQRMLGGLYQSALRSELTVRYGVTWQAIVNGQAELAGVPYELLECSRSAPARSTPHSARSWPSSAIGTVGIRHVGNARRWTERRRSTRVRASPARALPTCVRGGSPKPVSTAGRVGGSPMRWPCTAPASRPRSG
jgi:conjugative relaxase-like TrwC/TraI family protein